MARDKNSGKFIKNENSLTASIGVKVTPELSAWVKANGGAEYVRTLIEADKASKT